MQRQYRGDSGEFVVMARGGRVLGQSKAVKVGNPEINRPAKHQPFPKLARVVEGTGRFNRSVVSVGAERSSGGFEWYASVPATAAGIKSAVRRIRPQERERIAEVDTQIAEVKEHLRQLRTRRNSYLDDAWRHGHVVTLGEVERAMDGNARRYGYLGEAPDTASEPPA